MKTFSQWFGELQNGTATKKVLVVLDGEVLASIPDNDELEGGELERFWEWIRRQFGPGCYLAEGVWVPKKARDVIISVSHPNGKVHMYTKHTNHCLSRLEHRNQRKYPNSLVHVMEA